MHTCRGVMVHKIHSSVCTLVCGESGSTSLVHWGREDLGRPGVGCSFRSKSYFVNLDFVFLFTQSSWAAACVFV